MIQKLLMRLNWRLQYILILSLALTTAITVALGAVVTYTVINNYLKDAQDARVGRDMDLANAFYNNESSELLATANRLAAEGSVRYNLEAAGQGSQQSVAVVDDEIANAIANLPPGTQRFVVVTDADGNCVAGRVSSVEQRSEVQTHTCWADIEMVQSVLDNQVPESATEVVAADSLERLGLADQAFIELIDTPQAALQPYDGREGQAGLVLLSAAPVVGAEGQTLGSVLVGHLFNNDFALVDQIQEVADVDTATIFFGDLRVSTNVLDEQGDRAIGTRVSQEVYDQVLVEGKEFTGDAFVVNQWYITRYRPLYDHLGKVVGILYVGAKKAAFQNLVDSFASQLVLITIATILVAILIAIPLSLSISRPMTDLAQNTQRVAQGDWTVRAPVEGYREIRTLASSFNTMVAALEETQDQLIQKEKLASVGQLAAGVAHEINNPLGSVLLYADILHKETREEETQQKEDLQMIIREATRCKVIVNDLLNFSRQNEVMVQDTDVNALLQDLANELGKQPLYEKIEIETDLEPSLGIIQADPLQLHQVFVNLMNNAAEAMPQGGRLILRSRKGPTPEFVTIQVQDTGVGIPEENMKKVFTPFFTTKPIGRGTGLGLAIIYGIVKMHRGQISVQSKEGEGTTFTLTLKENLPSLEPAEGSLGLQ